MEGCRCLGCRGRKERGAARGGVGPGRLLIIQEAARVAAAEATPVSSGHTGSDSAGKGRTNQWWRCCHKAHLETVASMAEFPGQFLTKQKHAIAICKL